MSKDPAFLFYTGDFSTGTQFFSDDQVGKYLRLLMAQHQHGHLSENQMKFICKSYDKDIYDKFSKDSNGKFFNERLEDEIIKRKNFSESRSKNKLGKTKDLIITSKSYDNHMEDEDENKDINRIKEENEKKMFSKGIVFDLPKLSLILQSETTWLESIARKYKCSLIFVRDKILDFINHLETQDEHSKTIPDAKKHYSNWLNIQIQNAKRNPKKGKLQSGLDPNIILDSFKKEYPDHKF